MSFNLNSITQYRPNTSFTHANGTTYTVGAIGNYSVSLNGPTRAEAAYSGAFGYYTVAKAEAAFAFGYNTITSADASAKGQMVVGRYNANLGSTDLFAVGNGSSTKRSTAFTVKTDKVVSAVPIYINDTSVVTHSEIGQHVIGFDVSTPDGYSDRVTLLEYTVDAYGDEVTLVGEEGVQVTLDETNNTIYLSTPELYNTVRPDYFTSSNSGQFVTVDSEGNFVPTSITIGGSF